MSFTNFNQEDANVAASLDARKNKNNPKRTQGELADFKDNANVYYQQLTKAAKNKGLGSHEHIYFTYGIEWAYNRMSKHGENEKLKSVNDALLSALHWVVGSMSLERTDRFDILNACKAAIKKAE